MFFRVQITVKNTHLGDTLAVPAAEWDADPNHLPFSVQRVGKQIYLYVSSFSDVGKKRIV